MNTPRTAPSPGTSKLPRIIHLLTALGAGAFATHSMAEDWGAYSLVPASAQAMVLEAVGSGTDAVTPISIGKPVGAANQKWIITPKGDNLYTIKPCCNSTLALSAPKGEARMGASLALEKMTASPGNFGS